MKFKNILAITFALIFVVAFIAPSVSAWWIFGNNKATGDAKVITSAQRADLNTVKDMNDYNNMAYDINHGIISDTNYGNMTTVTTTVDVNNGVPVSSCIGTQSMKTLFVKEIKNCPATNIITMHAPNQITVSTDINTTNPSGGQPANQIMLLSDNVYLNGKDHASILSDFIQISGTELWLGTDSIAANNTVITSNNFVIGQSQIQYNKLTGTGTAYACLTATGQLYRSQTPCN